MFSNPRVGTAAAGGVAGAVVLLIAHTFTYFSGVEMSPDFQNALLIVGVTIGGLFAHQISEDQAALHKLILARLGDAQPAQPAQPLGPPSMPAIGIPQMTPQRSASELLRSTNAGQR